MELVIAPKGILQIDDAIIIYRNFAGAPSKYNREGDRNFAIVIPTVEMADLLASQGWNVKRKPPREEGGDEFMFLPVKMKFNDWGPKVYLDTGDTRNVLDATNVGILDQIEFERVDLDVRPSRQTVQGVEYQTAYVQTIRVQQRLDRFARPQDTLQF